MITYTSTTLTSIPVVGYIILDHGPVTAKMTTSVRRRTFEVENLNNLYINIFKYYIKVLKDIYATIDG